MRFPRLFTLLCASLLTISTSCALAQSAQPVSAAQPALNAPTITKVDPPNWWIGLPAPMLLIHGEHLDTSHITASAPGVHILRQQTSSNGHWVFLWLSTASSHPETVHITAANSSGHASFDFPLLARKSPQGLYQGFSSRDVMYLIMPDRFANGDPSNDHLPDAPNAFNLSASRAYHGGDLAGIEQHLDYLRSLGITTLWTTPLYDNAHDDPSSYHGYGATDMYAVNEHLGTLAGYQHLVASAHSQGLKVVLDTVPNHVGPRHPWVLDPPTPDWFHGTLAHHLVAKSPFNSITDPHAAFRQYRDTVQGWFADTLPDLDHEQPLVSQYLIQNAIWWIESAGLDGLRIDTFPYVGRPFWHDFHSALHRLYPNLTTVGEVFNPDPTITSYFAGGVSHAGTDGNVDTGLYTPFDFPVFFALRASIAHDEPMTKLQEILRQDWLYPHPERLVTFLGNHDTKRFVSEPAATPAKLQLALGLLATLRGMPQLYSGDEIAMSGGDDPDNRRDFPGGFSSSTHNAFTAPGRTPDEASTFTAASTLFQLRAHHPSLQTGQLFDIFCDDKTYAFVRTLPTETLLVIANNSDHPRTLDLDLNDTALEHSTRFTGLYNDSAAHTAQDHHLTLHLAPRQLLILDAR